MAGILKSMILAFTGGREMLFIDTNKIKTVWFAKQIKKGSFVYQQGEYIIDLTKMKNNICLYHTLFAEPIDYTLQKNLGVPLSFEFDEDRTKYFITSKEFLNAYNNKLHEKMMYVKEKNLLIYALVLSGFSIVLAGYSLYLLTQLTKLVSGGV